MKTNKLIILYGLPGSGKTFFVKQQNLDSYHTIVLDLDSIFNNSYLHNSKLQQQKFLLEKIISAFNYNKSIILDGLFTSNKDVAKIVNNLKDRDINDYILEIIYWKPDIEACLHNDLYRREKSSEITIKNCKLEYPDPNIIGKQFTLIEKTVETKSFFELNFNKFIFNIKKHSKLIIDENNMLIGGTWNGGGTWGNYLGNSGTIDAETPTKFSELNELVQLVCPEISYLNFINIYDKCYSINESSSNDYYGGHSITYCHKFDLKEFFIALENLKYITLT